MARPTYILLSVLLSVVSVNRPLQACSVPSPVSPCLLHFFVWRRRHWQHSGLASARGSSWVLDSTRLGCQAGQIEGRWMAGWRDAAAPPTPSPAVLWLCYSGVENAKIQL